MGFFLLLLTTLVIAVIVSGLVVLFFRKPIDKILGRVIADDISAAWRKFLTFALFVVGIASGVTVRNLEKFIQPQENGALPVLTAENWFLEIYRTIIGTLGGLAWALFVFFIVALIAFMLNKWKSSTKA